MKFNIHAGHNADGQRFCGAIGYLKESTEARKIKDELKRLLEGHIVYDCTCENGTSKNDVLQKIVAQCNKNKVDIDVSIHLNAGGGNGVEVYYYSDEMKPVSERICKSISQLGFKNRGAKQNKTFYVLKNTKSKAILIECCFVDSLKDYNIYNYKDMAKAIYEGLIGSYKVRVIADSLNIRSSSTYFSKKVGAITDKGVYTIVEEKNGWGKLKSGIGWVNLKYTKKL